MSADQWQLASAQLGDPRIMQLLRSGYEPFALSAVWVPPMRDADTGDVVQGTGQVVQIIGLRKAPSPIERPPLFGRPR